MPNKNYLPPIGDNSKENFYPQLDHFDIICGQIMKENKLLRYIVVVSCLAFFLSIGITFYAVSLPETVPVLVTMNDFGETKYIGPVNRKNFQNFNIPETAINFQVKNFVELFYGLSTDIHVMQKNYNRIFHLLTNNSATKFNQLVKEKKLYDDFGSKTREVSFETKPLKLSEDSYQVDFKVIYRDSSGSKFKTEFYRIVLTINTMQPSEEDINENPLGIYITYFDIKAIEKNKE